MLQKVKGFRFLCAAGNVKMNLQMGRPREGELQGLIGIQKKVDVD
jgi:hypothetical protein